MSKTVRASLNNITYFINLVLVAILATACSNTPNKITMTTTQGSCVQLNQYASKVQSNIATFYPQIKNNPTTATPYCMAVTLQNNNTGENANTVQITTGGLKVNFTIGSNIYSSIMVDKVAANVTSIDGLQTLGNLTIFDPHNCVTAQGANVINLSAGGGVCTFYLQILQEGDPVGVYPTSIVYNYTNGNQNYSLGTNINQRTYLYAGASNGLYFIQNNINTASLNPATTQITWATGINQAPIGIPIDTIVKASYGQVYFTSKNQVYKFNGITTTLVGESLPVTTINALSFNDSNTLYAATTQGVYVYESQSWMMMMDKNLILSTNSNIISFKGTTTGNMIYATTESIAYTCDNINLNTKSFTCSVLTNGNLATQYYPNSIDVSPANTLFSVANFSEQANITMSEFTGIPPWSFYTTLPAINKSQSIVVGQVLFESSSTLIANNKLYFSLTNQILAIAKTESALYTCNISELSCIPLMSIGGNPIVGNANSFATDGLGNIYVAGAALNSNDFGALQGSYSGAFLVLNTSIGGGHSQWVPIYSGNLTVPPIYTLTVASMLTSY